MPPKPCPDCDGTRWRVVTDDGGPRVERCGCWRADAARTLLAAARIPSRYRDCDLNTFVIYENAELLHAIDRARRFVEAFPAVDKGLLLIGPPGIGKTHIAVAVLRQVVSEKHARGLYYDTRTLLSTIRSTYDPVTRTSAVDVLRPVVEAELLVLDDLGAERMTDWVDETMNYIVNTRYNDRRPTIFTSNYKDSLDSDDFNSLFVRVGPRMHSRLHEMCEVLAYDGADYRYYGEPPEALLSYWKEKQKKEKQKEEEGQGPKSKLPYRTTTRARARLKPGEGELGWSGGRAGR